MSLGCEVLLYIRWGKSFLFKPCLFLFLYIPCLPTVHPTTAEQGWLKYISYHVVALLSGVLGWRYGLVAF